MPACVSTIVYVGGAILVLTVTRRRKLIGIWLVAALILGGALLAADRTRHPLDDPDLAFQRPGFLDAHHAPAPAPPVAPGVPTPGTRVVVFFTRPEHLPELMSKLARASSLTGLVQSVVVVSGAASGGVVSGVPVVTDPDGRLAAAFMLDRPRDGGPPVGYAVVDSHGQIRYRTLDPGMADRLDEVETMVRAAP